MRIGIALVEKNIDKEISQVFGRAPFFGIYDSESKEVTYYDNDALKASGGAGIQASQFLVDKKLDAAIAFRLGQNAVKVLSGAGIKLYAPKENLSARENIELLLKDELELLVDIHSGYHN